MRIGYGYDVHAFTTGRPLILGGVTIPSGKGLAGHSDADVLTHAIIDALLGAAAFGDIGTHFPDSDPRFKGISSLQLLTDTMRLIEEEHYMIGNIDTTIVLQRPSLAPYISEIRRLLCRTMGVDEDRLSVKATTTENLGFTGREEGVAAHAMVLLFQRPRGASLFGNV